jgi:hypothetical protein
VAVLLHTQRANDWTDAHMAGLLGVDASMWRFVRSRQRRPGNKLLGGVLRAFPHLAGAVSLFLARNETTVPVAGQTVPTPGGA